MKTPMELEIDQLSTPAICAEIQNLDRRFPYRGESKWAIRLFALDQELKRRQKLTASALSPATVPQSPQSNP